MRTTRINERDIIIVGLVANIILLNMLDVVLTIYTVENGMGGELNLLLNWITANSSIYHSMSIKLFLVTVAVCFVCVIREEIKDVKIRGEVMITGTNIIYTNLFVVNLIYYGIVINGILVIKGII